MSLSSSTGFNVREQPNVVISNGKTLYVGGNGPGNYTKIQDAIDNASDGDTVFVYNESSPYIEDVFVNKSINLIGEDRNSTIIDYNGNHWSLGINADWVNISRFTIQNSSSFGIEIWSNNVSIYDNIIINNSYSGIIIAGGKVSNNFIAKNIIKFNKWYGIWLNGSIINSKISQNNICSNYEYGIIVDDFCYCITISDNIISDIYNPYWEAIGIFLESDYNFVTGNIISNNSWGICIYNDSNTITGNDITNNTLGIMLYGFEGSCNKNVIIENNISTNNLGIKFDYNSNNNILYHNNFINNNQTAYDRYSNIWDDGYPSGGNYWDDYTGNDSDGDGIGDTPYPIPGGDNEDRYPLIKPWGRINRPYGPSKGFPGINYTFCFDLPVHPESNSYYVMWDWGDGKILIFLTA